MLQIPLDVQLDDSARLDNYFSDGNTQLIERLKTLSSESQDFIFVWGNDNSGKSHLAQAVCRNFSDNNLTAVYFPLDNSQLKPEVLEGLEFADLVCLDSIDVIAGKQEWEEGIFNLFNALKNSHRQFIIFSQQPPKDLSCNLADLTSRLSSMEIYKIRPLNEQQRVSFVIQKGEHRGLEITDEVAQFLLVRTKRDVNSLVEIIELLDKQSLAHSRRITIPFVKKILGL